VDTKYVFIDDGPWIIRPLCLSENEDVEIEGDVTEVVRGDLQLEEFWISGSGGRRVSTSVGGTFTGKGADLIIIDDPIKAGDVYTEV